MVVVLGACGAFLVGAAVYEWQTARRLADHGVTAVGRETGRWADASTSGRRSTRIEVEFDTPSGPHTTWFVVDDEDLANGAVLDVVYDPEDPDRNLRFGTTVTLRAHVQVAALGAAIALFAVVAGTVKWRSG
jgi:hypothetical protein